MEKGIPSLFAKSILSHKQRENSNISSNGSERDEKISYVALFTCVYDRKYCIIVGKKLALTSPTSCGRSVGIVRLRTKGHGV
jgi:hypothetical protein